MAASGGVAFESYKDAVVEAAEPDGVKDFVNDGDTKWLAPDRVGLHISQLDATAGFLRSLSKSTFFLAVSLKIENVGWKNVATTLN